MASDVSSSSSSSSSNTFGSSSSKSTWKIFCESCGIESSLSSYITKWKGRESSNCGFLSSCSSSLTTSTAPSISLSHSLTYIFLQSFTPFIAIFVGGLVELALAPIWSSLVYALSGVIEGEEEELQIEVEVLLASHGATAILLGCIPGSPVIQPRASILGTMIGAFCGVTIQKISTHFFLSYSASVVGRFLKAAIAVFFTIFLTAVTGSIHPPGGGIAIVAVLGSKNITKMGYVLILSGTAGTIVMILVGVVTINLSSDMRYPIAWWRFHSVLPNPPPLPPLPSSNLSSLPTPLAVPMISFPLPSSPPSSLSSLPPPTPATSLLRRNDSQG